MTLRVSLGGYLTFKDVRKVREGDFLCFKA